MKDLKKEFDAAFAVTNKELWDWIQTHFISREELLNEIQRMMEEKYHVEEGYMALEDLRIYIQNHEKGS